MRFATFALACSATLATMACSDSATGVSVGDPRRFDDHTEIDIEFDNGDAHLSGTLFIPTADVPSRTVVVNEGSSWTTRAGWKVVGPFASVLGSIFTFDKRGYGRSVGECCDMPDEELFPLLASDAVAAARALQGVEGVDPDGVGLLGSSFSGWTVPLAANMDRNAISFVIVAVGGAVSVGQEQAYDRITGYDRCTPSGITPEQAADSLEALGPSGWDPIPSLEELAQPALWLFGQNDLSHPTVLAVRNLERIQASRTKPWTVAVIPGANHDLIANGTICQTEGQPANILEPLLAFNQELDRR